MDNRIKQDYTVAVQSRNKITGAQLRVPVVTNRRIVSLDRAVELMTESGFMRGQTEDLKGTANGFFQGLQFLAKQGYTIDCADWIRVSGNLRGKVGADGRLTAENSYHVTVTTLKDLSVPMDSFDWNNVGGAAPVPRIDHIIGDATGSERGRIVKGAAILISGAKFGDEVEGSSVKFVFEDGTEVEGEVVTCSETLVKVAASAAIAELPSGTEVKVTVSRIVDGNEYSSQGKTVLVA